LGISFASFCEEIWGKNPAIKKLMMSLISQEVLENITLDRTQLISGWVILPTDFSDIAEDRLIRSALES